VVWAAAVIGNQSGRPVSGLPDCDTRARTHTQTGTRARKSYTASGNTARGHTSPQSRARLNKFFLIGSYWVYVSGWCARHTV